MTERMLSQRQVAGILGVTTRTIRNWERLGMFPQGARFGRGPGSVVRYCATDVEKFINQALRGKKGKGRKDAEK